VAERHEALYGIILFNSSLSRFITYDEKSDVDVLTVPRPVVQQPENPSRSFAA
jgi:hypothetical protein